jgi:uncharacterized protein YuzE
MKKKISISYDRDVDVLYLTFVEPTEAVGDEIEEGIFARYDPKTEELVGLTIINFSRKFGVKPKEVAVPILFGIKYA